MKILLSLELEGETPKKVKRGFFFALIPTMKIYVYMCMGPRMIRTKSFKIIYIRKTIDLYYENENKKGLR